jgi:hypothetical protein
MASGLHKNRIFKLERLSFSEMFAMLVKQSNFERSGTRSVLRQLTADARCSQKYETDSLNVKPIIQSNLRMT